MKLRQNGGFKLVCGLLAILMMIQADVLFSMGQSVSAASEEAKKEQQTEGTPPPQTPPADSDGEPEQMDDASPYNGMIQYEASRKKKKKFPWLWVTIGVAVVATAAIVLTKKKPKYTLTVEKGPGVDGNPGSGTYTVRKGKEIDFQYQKKSGYGRVIVTLDGEEVEPSGIISMGKNHTLTARAEEYGGIRVTSSPTNADIYLDDVLQPEQTPYTVTGLMPGQSYELTVRAPGYAGSTLDFIATEATQEHNVTLENIEYGQYLHANGAAANGYANGYDEATWFWFYVREKHYHSIQTNKPLGHDVEEIKNTLLYLYGPDDREKKITQNNSSGEGLYSFILRKLDPGNYYLKVSGAPYSKGHFSIRIVRAE